MKVNYQEKIAQFAELGPFETEAGSGVRFAECESGFRAVESGPESQAPIVAQKPNCGACDSAKPYIFYYLSDRFGQMHFVGFECYSRLCQRKLVTHFGGSFGPRRQQQ